MKTLTNKQWLDVAVYQKHKPVIQERGHPHNPTLSITCSCNIVGSRWLDYPHHLIDVLESEFPGLFSEKKDAWDGR